MGLVDRSERARLTKVHSTPYLRKIINEQNYLQTGKNLTFSRISLIFGQFFSRTNL